MRYPPALDQMPLHLIFIFFFFLAIETTFKRNSFRNRPKSRRKRDTVLLIKMLNLCNDRKNVNTRLRGKQPTQIYTLILNPIKLMFF